MGILFSAPQIEYKIIAEEWREKLLEIAAKGVFVGGPAVTELEKGLAAFTGTSHAVGVGNGTDALYMALRAFNIGPGDEVITVTNTFIATVAAIYKTGAKPVLVDCLEHDYLINPDQVLSKINDHTKAIIPVHLYGKAVDLTPFRAICGERNIKIIEDCAQAIGASIDGKQCGTLGDMGCFSFYPDKNLGALGDGGAIITDSLEKAEFVRMLGSHGGLKRYEHRIPGTNSRLDPIQAAALTIKLRYLKEWNNHRIAAAGLYKEKLRDLGEVISPEPLGDRHVFHLYVIRVREELREKLKKQLQKKGILTGIHYPTPVHLTEAFASLGYRKGEFPIAEKLSGEILSLPMHIGLREEDIDFIVQEIVTFIREN